MYCSYKNMNKCFVNHLLQASHEIHESSRLQYPNYNKTSRHIVIISQRHMQCVIHISNSIFTLDELKSKEAVTLNRTFSVKIETVDACIGKTLDCTIERNIINEVFCIETTIFSDIGSYHVIRLVHCRFIYFLLL